MILSVVIVSYNVKFFLEQCLSSLKKAVDGSELLSSQVEVFIIDNASTDGSLDFLRPLYPDFRYIQNKNNTGFAKANNQALSICTGEFVLFLNPDTIMAEDSLDRCIAFFRITPDAGALGVNMIDGTGRYLKESKRGFPGPATSFYKMTGLAGLFPRSKIFSSYYLGHLDEKKSHAVDILSGAFMMIKKAVLDKTGGFDERFFMYAEDIDLSWRIRRSGFMNYYLSSTTIIHFKGESTPKDIRYNKMFHSAMELFMKKHFSDGRPSLKLFALALSVRLHQALSYFKFTSRKTDTITKDKLTIYLKGDPPAKEKWKDVLAMKNISVTESEENSEEIIFCEGPLLSWKMIIQEIKKRPPGPGYHFYGSGTHAAVSSYSSRYPGEFFEI